MKEVLSAVCLRLKVEKIIRCKKKKKFYECVFFTLVTSRDRKPSSSFQPCWQISVVVVIFLNVHSAEYELAVVDKRDSVQPHICPTGAERVRATA